MNVQLIRRLLLVGVLALFTLLVTTTSAFAAGPWNLSQDFAARGTSAGAWAQDADGNTVWYFKDASSATNPATFSAANLVWTTTYSWMPPATPGLKGWVRSGVGLPHVSVNTGANAVSTTTPPFTWESGKVLTHPMPATDAYPYAVIEWKSPVAGEADATIALSDIDLGGSTGFEYWVLHNADVVATALVGRGGTATPSLANVDVATGDSIFVVVGPGGPGSTDHYWDTTQVDFDVSVTPPPVTSTPASSVWTVAILTCIAVVALPVVLRRRVSG